MPDPSYRQLLIRSVGLLAFGTGLVVVCYFWVDRPVAFFVHDHHINQITVFKWLTYPPPLVQSWSPVILALLMIARAFTRLDRWQKVLLVACLSLMVGNEVRVSLGDVSGRYWPETWRDDNPSLIGNDTYGFHPFVHGDDLGSFPSGHAARILGFATVWWMALPRSRAVCLLCCPPMLISLVAMNYHFVGDVVAGSVLGAIVGMYAVRLADLHASDRVI